MVNIARIKMTNDKGLEDTFCIQLIPSCVSQDSNAFTSIYKEFSDTVIYTTGHELIKRDTFLHNRHAQLKLRDKIKFYASSK